jgi:hypothetical protein
MTPKPPGKKQTSTLAAATALQLTLGSANVPSVVHSGDQPGHVQSERPGSAYPACAAAPAGRGTAAVLRVREVAERDEAACERP